MVTLTQMVILTPNNGKTMNGGKVGPKTGLTGQNFKSAGLSCLLPAVVFSRVGCAWRCLRQQHHLKQGSYREQKSQK